MWALYPNSNNNNKSEIMTLNVSERTEDRIVVVPLGAGISSSAILDLLWLSGVVEVRHVLFIASPMLRLDSKYFPIFR